MGVSVGVGGGFGFFGVIAFGLGLGGCMSGKKLRRGLDLNLSSSELGCCMFFGIAWCLGWSAGVVIWGGVDGAMIVGIVWGVSLLVSCACCLGLASSGSDEQLPERGRMGK